MAGATEAGAGDGGTLPAAAGTSAHPEELRATVDLRVGDRVRLAAAARTTPAGLMAVGLMVSSILMAVALVVRAAGTARDRRHP